MSAPRQRLRGCRSGSAWANGGDVCDNGESRRVSKLTVVSLTFLCIIIGLVAAPISADQFLVTKLTDSFDGTCDADCSLREAITAANDNPGFDEVLLMPGTHLLTVNGASEEHCATGDLDVKDDLDLVGAGSGVSVIDGSGFVDDDRVLHVRSGVVEIRSLTVQGGSATGYWPDGAGGGIFNEVTLTIRDCEISNNTAEDGGGGIRTDDESNLVIVDSAINDNIAYAGGGIHSWGGEVTLINCDVLRNDAGGLAVGAGGPVPQDGGNLMVVDSRIQHNHNFEHGGGISIFASHAVIHDSLVEFNSSDWFGGGISTQAGARLFIVRGSVSYNTSVEEGGGINSPLASVQGTSFVGNVGYDGGAIYGGYGAELFVEDCTFDSNVATGVFGGAICTHGGVTVIGSTFVNNQATADLPGFRSSTGAAIYAGYNYSSLLVDSTVTGNTSSMAVVEVDGHMVVRSSTIVGNEALFGTIGGIGNGETGSIDIAGSVVTGNVPHDCVRCGAAPPPTSSGTTSRVASRASSPRSGTSRTPIPCWDP